MNAMNFRAYKPIESCHISFFFFNIYPWQFTVASFMRKQHGVVWIAEYLAWFEHFYARVWLGKKTSRKRIIERVIKKLWREKKSEISGDWNVKIGVHCAMYIYHINFNLPQSPSLQKLKANAYWQCDYVRIVNFKLKTSWHIIAEKPTTSIYNNNTFMVFRQTPMTIAGKIAKSKSRVTFICKMLWLHVSCSFAYGIRSHIVRNACKSQRFIVYIIQCVQELYSRQQYRS